MTKPQIIHPCLGLATLPWPMLFGIQAAMARMPLEACFGPTLRRMAFAVVCLSPAIPFAFQFGVKGALPGLVQTVPRGELFAIFQVVDNGIQSGIFCLHYR